MKPIPPGDDVCPVPPPVDEEPPHDRWCDLVLTGGVASGVVYPWAIVELARAYRFRNIGGTSVGAMAAALAAAAEYGRRQGYEHPFEALRLLPSRLGEGLPDGQTRMQSLFQAAPKGRRLLDLWARLGKGTAVAFGLGPFVRELLAAYKGPILVGAAAGALAVAVFGVIVAVVAWPAGTLWPPLLELLHSLGLRSVGWLLAMLLAAGAGAVLGGLWALWRDIKLGLVDNGLGLCRGGTLGPEHPFGSDAHRPGLCEWLHQGIQASAGLALDARPLTFRDLWSAPLYPGGEGHPRSAKDAPRERSINLQMITTNVTHGRPYRLPLDDETSRLFFKPQDLQEYLPGAVLQALVDVSLPYLPRSSADPQPSGRTQGFLELPGADMPVVVAARLSLSFPLLFAAVPLYAIDYEAPPDQRDIKRCWFSDGGVSSNFPIHLFDSALPRWPTFGMWLDRADPYAAKRAEQGDDRYQDVWLPQFHREGRADNWNRFDAAAAAQASATPQRQRELLFGFLLGLLSNALDWRDRTSFRLPQVRNRVARLLLRRGEGGLNIAMPREQILGMAHRYGTAAGKLFVERFAATAGEVETPAWREQRWVRLQVLLTGLRERLTGLSTCVAHAAHVVPMAEAIAQAEQTPPLRERPEGRTLDEAQMHSLQELLHQLKELEWALEEAEPQHYQPVPKPELRLRAPL